MHWRQGMIVKGGAGKCHLGPDYDRHLSDAKKLKRGENPPQINQALTMCFPFNPHKNLMKEILLLSPFCS